MRNFFNRMRMILSFCLFLIVSSVYAEGASVNGTWSGWSESGDIKVLVDLNVDNQEALNPYEPESLCNGFISVQYKEPSGNLSLLSTHELELLTRVGDLYEFSYSPGRDMDEGHGKCSIVLDDGSISFQISATADNIPVSFTDVKLTKESASGASASTGESVWDTVLEILVASLVMLAIVAMLAHMLYVYFKGKRYKQVYTPQMMSELRVAAGKSAESTGEENIQCFDLLEEAYMCWSEVEPDEEGNPMRSPTKMKQIKQSCAYIDQAIALQVTDPDVLDRLNEMMKVINVNEERSFDGSKALLWLGVIIGVLSFWIFDVQTALTILISTGVYVMASRTPLFLIVKRQERSGGRRSMGIVGGILAMIGSAKTVRTVYKFDDGTKAYEDDHSQHWIALFLGLVLLIAVAFLMFFWAIFNYLRNYILYF